ncbi:hypothetical protein [Roseateles oligotrophus]|uniref:Uncharacterized protein n=1 Tax=Roseateles oligotrophus TaxID=1769250 RepID=A0ABT2Y8F7_9BURK|nr:hypothetical protein [Roseateles oligotrophus]MCV2366582.1 hypothetical protein [Roseateles oligotrophus]
MTANPDEPILLSEFRIVRAVADLAAKRLTRRAISHLRKMPHTLSGDDSSLTNTWDEICVQVQGEQSYFWDAYEAAMRDALAWDVSQLARHELEALWLQTSEGEDWSASQEEGEASDDHPVCDEDIVRYIVRDHLLIEADAWSNTAIRGFLKSAHSLD